MASEKILVVDDEKRILKMVKVILKKAGYLIEDAGNGQEALKKAAAFAPDLLIMDVMLPDMNGGEVVQAIHTRLRRSDIPVIFLTGIITKAEASSDALEVRLEGVWTKTLAKPFQEGELLSAVQSALAIRKP